MPQKLTLHHMWGGCAHVTSVSGNIEPAQMQPATVSLHQKGGPQPELNVITAADQRHCSVNAVAQLNKKQAKLNPAQGNGFTAIYKNALFGTTQEQEFGTSGTGGFNGGRGNFSGSVAK